MKVPCCAICLHELALLVLQEVLFRALQPRSLGKKAPWRGKAASKKSPEHPQLLTCCSLDRYLEII